MSLATIRDAYVRAFTKGRAVLDEYNKQKKEWIGTEINAGNLQILLEEFAAGKKCEDNYAQIEDVTNEIMEHYAQINELQKKLQILQEERIEHKANANKVRQTAKDLIIKHPPEQMANLWETLNKLEVHIKAQEKAHAEFNVALGEMVHQV